MRRPMRGRVASCTSASGNCEWSDDPVATTTPSFLRTQLNLHNRALPLFGSAADQPLPGICTKDRSESIALVNGSRLDYRLWLLPAVRGRSANSGRRPQAVGGTFQVERPVRSGNGRSRVASIARYKHAAERLHLKAANRRCRPRAGNRPSRLAATKPSSARRRASFGR